MRGLRNIYNHPYTFSFLVVFIVLNLVRPAFLISGNTLTSSKSLTISLNRTILSPGHVFELGLFKPASNSSKWYLGMWYHKVPEAYVWVANRDNPLSTSIGILKISGGNIVLLDHSGTLVWSTNRTGNTRSPLVAELLDNGNFVLRESSNNNYQDGFLWQSFDFPTDTLLPQMKLGLDRKTGRNKVLIAWKSLNDPSSGEFSYELILRGLPEFFLLEEGLATHRSGPWDGIRFSGIPEKQVDYMVYNYTDNRDEIVYTFLVANHIIHSILKLSSPGRFDRLTWNPKSLQWYSSWTSPKDECDLYRRCGTYSYCDANTSPICNCIQGFDPKYPQQWELSNRVDGCVRRTRLSCRDDKFLRLKKMKLPDTKEAIVDRRIGLKECKERCLKDCNCTAVANIDIRGSGCVIWIGEFFDIRTYAVDSQDLYVRLAAGDIGTLRH